MTDETAVPAVQLAQLPLPKGAKRTLLKPTWVNREYVGGPVWTTFLKSYEEAPDTEAILGRLHIGFDINLSGEDRVSRIQFYCQVADGWYGERSQIRSSAMNLLCKHVFEGTGENSGMNFCYAERFIKVMRWFFQRETTNGWGEDLIIRNVGNFATKWEGQWVKNSRIKEVHRFLLRLADAIVDPVFFAESEEERVAKTKIHDMLRLNEDFAVNLIAILETNTEKGMLEYKHRKLISLFEAVALFPNMQSFRADTESRPAKDLVDALQHGGTVTSRLAGRLLLTQMYNRQFEVVATP